MVMLGLTRHLIKHRIPINYQLWSKRGPARRGPHRSGQIRLCDRNAPAPRREMDSLRGIGCVFKKSRTRWRSSNHERIMTPLCYACFQSTRMSQFRSVRNRRARWFTSVTTRLAPACSAADEFRAKARGPLTSDRQGLNRY